MRSYINAILAAASLVNALPDGAPGCDVQAAMKMPPNEPDAELAYSLDVAGATEYTAGTPMTVTVTGEGDQMAGILIYAESAADAKTRLGTWMSADGGDVGADGLYKSNSDKCQDFGCEGDACAVTHTSPDPAAASFQFQMDTSQGDIIIRAVVVKENDNGNVKFQILDPVNLTDAEGGAPIDGGAEAEAPGGYGEECACEPVKKCLKYKDSAAAPEDSYPEDGSYGEEGAVDGADAGGEYAGEEGAYGSEDPYSGDIGAEGEGADASLDASQEAAAGEDAAADPAAADPAAAGAEDPAAAGAEETLNALSESAAEYLKPAFITVALVAAVM